MHFAQSIETKASATKVYCSAYLDVLSLCCAGVHVNKRKQSLFDNDKSNQTMSVRQ